MFNPGPQMVPIASNPAGAVVSYRGAEVGVTPCTVALRWRRGSIVELTLAGHHRQLVDCGGGLNGWVFGNLLFGGVIGIFVDLWTGSEGEIEDAPVSVELVPLSEKAPGVWTRPPPPSQFDEEDSDAPIWLRRRYTDK